MAMMGTGERLDAEAVEIVYRRLAAGMPGRTPTAKGPKDQPDAFRSVVSCLLSAQSLDRNTALAAARLFELATTPEAILALDEPAIAAAIKPCGLYNIKARNLRRLAQALIETHGGTVPRTRAELMALPGIGRKCADIVLSFTFGKAVIAVDTHVDRVANRIGLTDQSTADRTADELEARTPHWARADGHFWLIQFGKAVCLSRRPRCETCFLADLCLFFRGAARARPEPSVRTDGPGRQRDSDQ